MAQFNRNNYINIPGFAVTDLKLSGNELICFSLVYGFTQDGETDFSGSLGYVASALNVTKANAKAILSRLVSKQLIVKKDQVISGVKFCHYAINNAVIETITGYYQNNNGGNIETITNNNINNNNNINKDISLFDKVEGIKEESMRGEKEGEFARHTIENLCIFPDSKFAKFEDFAAEFKAPEYAQIDIYYYWQVIMDWSRSNANKKRDWIATARNWIRNDAAAGKLRRVQQQAGVALSPDAVHYLEMAGGLFDE